MKPDSAAKAVTDAEAVELKVRADERERIAQAIEAEYRAAPPNFPPAWFSGLDLAARIARSEP